MIKEIAGQNIEILNVNVQQGTVDWRRTEGYTGACVSTFSMEGISTWADIETAAIAAIAADLAG